MLLTGFCFTEGVEVGVGVAVPPPDEAGPTGLPLDALDGLPLPEVFFAHNLT